MDVILSRNARKEVLSLPSYLQDKLAFWIRSVREFGLEKVRLSKGFHDEPLKGERLGQRSIRLNRAYRAIYIIHENGKVEFVEIIEVNKHDY